MAKKKLDIKAEDVDVARNLGVSEEQITGTKKEKPVKLDRKKVARVREAMNIGGTLSKEDTASVREKRRYHRALQIGSLHSGMTLAEMKEAQNTAGAAARAAENAASEEKARKSAKPVTSSGTDKLSEDELKKLGKKAAEEKARRESSPGFTPFKMPTRGRFEKPVTIGTPKVDATGEITGAETTRAAAPIDDVIKTAATSQSSKTEMSKAVADLNKTRKEQGLPPQFSPLASSASLKPLPRMEAPSIFDFTAKRGEKAKAELEKARPIIAKRTGKAPETISYAGDEPYDVKDSNGNVVATRSVNSHALQLAQKAHREAKRTGKEVQGIKPTDAKPTKTEDIIGTPHQAMAYQLRHLPGLSEADVQEMPGLSRRGYQIKSEALMGAAVNKAESNRMIPVANEVRPGHRWEDEKGMQHDFTFEKTKKGEQPRVSPLSLPEDFTRTAQPKAMIHIPDEESTQSLMGAHEVDDADSINHGFHTISKNESSASQAGKKSGMTGKIQSYEPDAIVSHEGWTLHTDNVWRKIKHPLANVPEHEKMHVGDYVAATAATMIDDKKEAAKSSKTKKATKALSKALSGTQSYQGYGSNPVAPNYLTNPRAPKAEINKEMLVRNVGAVEQAVQAKDITKKQAALYSPQFRPSNKKGIQAGKSLVGTPRTKKGDFPYKSKEELKGLSKADRKTYREDLAAHEAKQQAKSLKKQQAFLSPKKDYYDRFVDVKPVGKTQSSAFTKAHGEVSAGRQWRTVEMPKEMNLVVNEHNMEGQGLSQDQKAAVKDLGTAIVKVKNTYGLTPKEARKKGAVGQRSARVMADERGPVRDTEVFSHMQHMPERTDVQQAVRTGKIHPEEAKDLRMLDQFSPYKKEGATRGKEGLNEIKYSRLFEPVLAPKPKTERQGVSVTTLNEQTARGMVPRTEASMGAGTPMKEVKRPKKGAKEAPEHLKGVYGEIVDTPKAKPENRGRRGSVTEGRGRQFSNWVGKQSVKEGTTMAHPVHGFGLVMQHHEAGTTIPGTGTVVQRGNATKETKLKGAKKFDTPHVSFAPKNQPGKIIHVPVSDFEQ